MKVAIVGDSQIGKTTLILKYIDHKNDKEPDGIAGLNVMEKSIELKNCVANLQIYDLSGHRQFANMLPRALEQTKAVIFAFSLIDKASLISMKRWYKDVRKLNKVFKPILVGTKYDLFKQKENLHKLEVAMMARSCAKKMNAPLIMCSSKTTIHLAQVCLI